MNGKNAGGNAIRNKVPANGAVVLECAVRWVILVTDAMESLEGRRDMNVRVCYAALMFLFNMKKKSKSY